MARRVLAQSQIHVLVAFLAAVLLAWPLLQIAAGAGLWPLWRYVFGVWAGLIVVAAVFVRAINGARRRQSPASDQGDER